MSQLQYLTAVEIKQLTENMEYYDALLDQLSADETNVPTLTNGNTWEYLQSDFNALNINDFLEVMDIEKNLEATGTTPDDPSNIFHTLITAFSSDPIVDNAYNMRALFIVCSLANMVKNFRNALYMKNYLRYEGVEANGDTNVVILEERNNPYGSSGFHYSNTIKDATTRKYSALMLTSYGMYLPMVAQTLTTLKHLYPNDKRMVEGFVNSLMADPKAKHYVLLAKHGSLNACDQSTLTKLANSSGNPFDISYDGWEARLTRPLRFIDGVYADHAVEAVCEILNATFVRTSMMNGDVIYADLGKRSEYHPIEVWLPLLANNDPIEHYR